MTAPAVRPSRFGSRSLRTRLTLGFAAVVLGVGTLVLLIATLLVRSAFDATPPPPSGAAVVVQNSTGERLLVPADQFQQLLQRQAERRLVQQGLLVLLGVTAVGVLAGALVTGRALRPVQQLTATARALSTAPLTSPNLDARIAMTGPQDELKDMADTFDAMLERLERAFASQQRFVANASHELRTPLAVMRTEIDVTLADPDATPADLRAMGAVVREATERADRLVDALLLLARSDQGRLGERELVTMPALVEQAAATVRAEAADRGLRLETRLDPAVVDGDPQLLARLVGNLVENGVRHNHDGGWVAVGTGTVEGRVRLVVASSGPVVDSDDAAGLFEPFRRLGGRRTGRRGAGLGLSIVRSVAQAHGGQAHARPVSGGGLEVVVELPAAPD